MAILFFINILFYIILYLSSKIKSETLNSKFVLNINGNSHKLNFYYITLFVGENKENQTYLIDTTSSITTSPCSLCYSCGDHVNEYFNIKSNSSIIKSSSYQCIKLQNNIENPLLNKNDDNCNFYQDFNDGIISGFYTNNLIRFEPITLKNNNQENEEEYVSKNEIFELPLGCSIQETGSFQTRISDGILGLSNNKISFISMLYYLQLIKNNLFSLCFDEYGGYFSLGEIDTKYHISNISYVDLYSNNELYQLEINKFLIGSTEINNKYISIIDTSSTISFFPKDIFNLIMVGFFSECEDKKNECGKIKREEGYGICAEFNNLNEMHKAINYIWPSIKIEFNGYEFIWEPKNYYLNFSTDFKSMACLGFETDENIKDSIILGTNFMHGYDIIFDKEKNRIGFAEAECGRNMHKKLDLINNKIIVEKEKNKKYIDKILEEKKNEEIIQKQKEIQEKEYGKENEYNTTYKNNNNLVTNFYIYFLSFIIFIILFILFVINYINYNNYNSFFNNEKNKYKTPLIDDENEEKENNKYKSIGQMIEMVNDENKNNG